MRRRLFSGVLVIGLTALAVTGCSDDPTTPTTPTSPISVIETFSGVLTVNGAVTFPFSSAAGSVNTTVTRVEPDTSIVFGVSIGTVNGTTCQMVLSNDNAGLNALVTGAVREAGTLCARVYDVGKLTAPLTFTLKVEHF